MRAPNQFIHDRNILLGRELMMLQIASRRLYSLRFLVMLVWSCAAFWFWLLAHVRVLVWLAILPDWLGTVAIVPASHQGIVVLTCILLGASSLLLWRWFPVKWSASLAVLIPILFLVGSLTYGRIDTQGTDLYVTAPARRGDLHNTREQLAIEMAQYGLSNELQALIRVGTNVNARNSKGHSALYWAKEPELVKLLLQAGAKPDSEALVQAAFWGRLDTMKLLFAATPDDGRAIVADGGDRALYDATHVRASGEQDREQIVQMLRVRGVKVPSNYKDNPLWH